MTFKPTAMAAISALLALNACTKPPPEAPAAPVAMDVQPWVGRWQGPEATFLDIGGSAGAYRVTVQNLDGPRSFDATASGAGLSFVRDGVTETIRPGDGAATGMKWLADKKDCLVVKAGEGYCRG